MDVLKFNNNTIENLFQQAQAKGTGQLAAGFMDLSTGDTVYLNGDTPIPPASVVKIFILCQLFQMEKDGKLSFSTKHTLLESEKSIGSGILEKAQAGTEFTVWDYINLMMSVSDNTATDYLTVLAGKDNIRKNIFERLGLSNSTIELNALEVLTCYYNTTLEKYRKMCTGSSWFDSYMGSFFRCEEKRNNQTTARDMVKLLSLMNKGQVISPESDKRMLDIMAECKTNSRIPALLPEGVRVEHKTGSVDHVANDAGIVRTEKGDYILVMFYNGNIGSREEYDTTRYTQVGDKILRELSYDIYQAFTQSK